MSRTGIPPRPNTVPAAEARERLFAARFSQLPDDPSRPRTQLWKNSNGKVVSVDFTDETLAECWEESLELALTAKDLVPAHPWSSWWASILGKDYKPS